MLRVIMGLDLVEVVCLRGGASVINAERDLSTSGHNPIAVLGAGPAGLTAAYALAGRDKDAIVLEADQQVGGLAKTRVREGYRFDLGGHRFFTKSPEVNGLWDEVLGEELLTRRRMSRIHWKGRFLNYPLDGMEVVRKLGPVELGRALASYSVAQLRPRREAENLEEWVSHRFGRRLYEQFFRAYTEKVWGVPCTEIRAEWAAQRIKGLSFFSAARNAFLGSDDDGIRSLISEFRYPRLGPGQMWEQMRIRIVERGGEVRLNSQVQRLKLDGGRVAAVIAGGEELACDGVISSLPLAAVVNMIEPSPPAEVREAAAGLRHRDFLTVALVLEGEDPFPDNWIYVHEPEVRVGRIQNYRAWSEAMVPDPQTACLGLEYFCFRGDDLWQRSDEALVALAGAELEHLGLASADRVRRGFVERVPLAYPIYDAHYAERVRVIRSWLDTVPNLEQVGRNGLHRYNNSDHSMLTALRAVENLLDGAGNDIWQVNAGSVYHETEVPEEQPYRNASEVAAEPVASEL